MKLSIITPVYNMGNEITVLFEALNKQTCYDFELVLVEDGSPEEKKEELKKAFEIIKFEYLYVENERNLGAGKTRNNALYLVSGDYIVFVDSDDYVTNDFVEKITNAIRKSKSDVIMFDLYQGGQDEYKIQNTLKGYKRGYITREDAILYASTCVAGKCYRRSIIQANKIEFPSLLRYEDWVFNVNCFCRSNAFYYIDEPLYYYLYRSESIVNKFQKEKCRCALDAYLLIEKLDVEQSIIDFVFFREVAYLYFKESLLNKNNVDMKPFIEQLNRKTNDQWCEFIEKKHINMFQYFVLICLKMKWCRYWLKRKEN